MASGSYEFRDFDVGGIPRYAQRETAANPGPPADFAAYGEAPDRLPGASSKGNGNELQDPDAERGAGENLADDGPAWLKFGDLEDDEPDGGGNHAADGAPDGDEDLLDEVVIPAQSAEADTPGESAAGSTEHHDPADDAATEDTAHPEAAETPDKRFDDETAGPNEAADIIAAEFGLDTEEARRLVAEAQADLDAEAATEPSESDEVDDGSAPGGSAADEHEGEAEAGTAENVSPRDRVVSFLRRAASKTGEITRNEAAEFAEGARALGDDFREWYAGRDERSRERALDRVRNNVAKKTGKWDKFEEHRIRTGVQAPRGDEDR